MKYKSYKPKHILNVLSVYNLGYTLKQTEKEIAKRFKIKIPLSTIHSWVKKYRKVCRYERLREKGRKLISPKKLIFTKNLYHNQIYEFQVHRFKLPYTLGYRKHKRFSPIKDYLKKVSTNKFPHHIFKISDKELEQRASQMKMNRLKVKKAKKKNLANKLAELGLMLAKNNRDRHPSIQEFMIINDSVTIATEVPVYLTGDDIKYFKRKGFNFSFKNYRTPITGHIDVLQIRNGLIHILDYKPKAKKVKPIEQLIVYALALASKTKLAVKDFKTAWFDEENYYEFYPLHAVYNKR
jgi:ATP-dependent exoDNAse (exonuclease V) beta subunit